MPLIRFNNLIKKALIVTTQKLVCATCIALKYVTDNEDAAATFIAGNVCSFCAYLFGREAYGYYDSLFGITKKMCKLINSCSRFGLTYWLRKGPRALGDTCPISVEYGPNIFGDGI